MLTTRDHRHTFRNQNALSALRGRGLVHTLLHTPALLCDQIPCFFAQVDLIWNNLEKQHGVCAAAELNKALRYTVSFSAIMQL